MCAKILCWWICCVRRQRGTHIHRRIGPGSNDEKLGFGREGTLMWRWLYPINRPNLIIRLDPVSSFNQTIWHPIATFYTKSGNPSSHDMNSPVTTAATCCRLKYGRKIRPHKRRHEAARELNWLITWPNPQLGASSSSSPFAHSLTHTRTDDKFALRRYRHDLALLSSIAGGLYLTLKPPRV